MRLKEIARGVILSLVCGWTVQTASLYLLKYLNAPSRSGLSAPLTISVMAFFFLSPFKNSLAKRLRRFAIYFLAPSMLFLASGLLLAYLDYSNPAPLALLISLTALPVLSMLLKALQGQKSTKPNNQCPEVVAVCNFPRPMLFLLDKNGLTVSRAGGIKMKDKGLLDGLSSKFLSFPFSIGIKANCSVVHFINQIMTSELSRRVALLARASHEGLTISAGSTEMETLYDFVYRTSQLTRSKDFANCCALHASTPDLAQSFKGYSPPLKLGCFRVQAGMLSGRWLLVCNVHELKSLAKDLVPLGLGPLFHVKLSVRERNPSFVSFRSPFSLQPSLLRLRGPHPLKFNVLLSNTPNKHPSKNWDLVLEGSDRLPEVLEYYDGVLFIRPTSESEVVRLLPAHLSYLSGLLSGKALAFNLKSRMPITLPGESHEGT